MRPVIQKRVINRPYLSLPRFTAYSLRSLIHRKMSGDSLHNLVEQRHQTLAFAASAISHSACLSDRNELIP